MVKVEFSDDARDWIQGAEKDVREQFGKRLQKAEENPSHFLKPLTGSPNYKLRAGDYRAEVQWVKNSDDEDILFIRRAGHRDGFWD